MYGCMGVCYVVMCSKYTYDYYRLCRQILPLRNRAVEVARLTAPVTIYRTGVYIIEYVHLYT